MNSNTPFSKAAIAELYAAHFREAPETAMGWTFMYCPQARLSTARAGIIGLNPGADREDSDAQTQQADWDWPRGGMAYTDQKWGLADTHSPLQQQIVRLLATLEIDSSDVFAAQFVPFRSRSWAKLPAPEGALAAMQPLWREVANRSPTIKLWISLGKRAGRELAAILEAGAPRRLNVGWNRQFAELYQAPDGRVVLALPHLSRFKLMTTADRSEVEASLAEAKRLSGLA